MNAIEIENLWKEYRLGVIGHGTLTRDLQSWWARINNREDPNTQVLTHREGDMAHVSGDRLWALQGINLEIEQGNVVGIIGKNGAGKSTLLKILSRVTAPTEGIVKIKGRIASLLEVGTGFHPELTGKENVFLNGSILGLTKKEIQDRLDEIVDFSGIELFMDTPVKRYSSGMRVRLGFAVAAHLEPEILIVDEVLAVGDAEFQQKCIGKMKDVSEEGRTVIFVSHNMQVIRRLCPTSIMMENGQVSQFGDTFSVLDSYLGFGVKDKFDGTITPEMRSVDVCNPGLEIYKIELFNNSESERWEILFDETCTLRIHYRVNIKEKYYLSILLKTMEGQLLAGSTSREKNISLEYDVGREGFLDVELSNILVPGRYLLQLLVKKNREMVDSIDGIELTVKNLGLNKNLHPGYGVVRLPCAWKEPTGS